MPILEINQSELVRKDYGDHDHTQLSHTAFFPSHSNQASLRCFFNTQHSSPVQE